MPPQKKVVVIAGPSGSGKNTIINLITATHPNAQKLVTATTRTPREGEVEGADYFFFSSDQFDAEEAQGNIVGKRFVPILGGIRYGIYLPDLTQRMTAASVVFAPVDITGMRWLKEHHGAFSIFLVPESLDEYRMRVRARNPDMNDQEFNERMKITEREVRIDAAEYDHRVVSANGTLPETVEKIVEILQKEGYAL